MFWEIESINYKKQLLFRSCRLQSWQSTANEDTESISSAEIQNIT